MTFKEFLAHGAGPGGDGGGGYGSGGGGGGGGGGATRAPLQIQLSDPVALRAQINQAAQSALGRDLTDEEANKFVSAFQSKEKAAQTAAYNGASEYTQPDASAMAMDSVKQDNETEYKNQQQGQYVRAFASMMGASF